MQRSSPFRLSLGLFFCSGVCALAYETVWVRQLTFSFGISVYAISAVLAAFMFGLCAGSYVLGKWARRITNPLRVYAIFEFIIAGYTLLLYFVLADLLPLIYRFGYGLLPHNDVVLSVARFALTFVLLSVPTTLMGGTLPVLSRYLRQRDGTAGSALGWLYGINTLGACLGTALAGFLFLEHLGLFKTTLLMVLVNLVIALVALWFSRAEGMRVQRAPEPAATPAGATSPVRASRRLILLALFFSGYTALSYEVIWNRTLLLYTHNSTYAFSTILIVFLLGIALGSMLYARLPARLTGARALGVLQLLIAAYVWGTFHVIGKIPTILAHVTFRLGDDNWFSALMTIVVATMIIVLVPTILMGMTFPMGTALAARGDDDSLSTVAGRAYAFLTLGNILGSLATGFFLIELVGLRNAFAVAVALNLLAGSLLVGSIEGRVQGRRVAGALAAAGTALFLFLLDVDRGTFRRYYEEYFAKQHGQIIFYQEDLADNVMVYELRKSKRWVYYSDGRGTAGTPTNDENRRSGHIPMLLHPDPQKVLSICFGVGNTLSAMAMHGPDKLVCVELSKGAIAAAKHFPTNQNVLEEKGLTVEIEDGRNYLLRTKEKFDIIQLEPPELHQAAVVNLYTSEFYDLAKQQLADDGILCHWYSTLMPEYEQKMVLRAFLDAFPNGSMWQSNHTSVCLVGWHGDPGVTPEQFHANAADARVAQDLKLVAGPERELDLMAYHLLGPRALAQYVGDVPPVTDDRTYIDFTVPRSREAGFGVWVYFTNQDYGKAYSTAIFDNMIFHLRMEEMATPPDYAFDLSALSPEQRESFLNKLHERHERRRSRDSGRLKHMLKDRI